MEGKVILAISLSAVLLIGVISFDDANAEEKITICHFPDSDKPKTKQVKEKDLAKHLAHGDIEEACPVPTDPILELIAALQAAIADTSSDIQQILGLLTDPIFGLEEIKTEVAIIETEVQDPDTGLAAIKTAVDDIDTSGISASTQAQIDNIESRVANIESLIIQVISAVDSDGDGILLANDCNDSDSSIGAPITWYRDSDNDGFGDITSLQIVCTQPVGFIEDNTDCDDTNSLVNPGLLEDPLDGVDNDCDGTVDESDFTGTWTYSEISYSCTAGFPVSATSTQVDITHDDPNITFAIDIDSTFGILPNPLVVGGVITGSDFSGSINEPLFQVSVDVTFTSTTAFDATLVLDVDPPITNNCVEEAIVFTGTRQ